MRYASIEDMSRALGADTLRAIADHDGDRVADDDVVLRALDEASALADTYIPREISPHIPADAIPMALRRAVVIVASTYLREARDMMTDDARASYAAVIRWLERIAAGTASLGVTVPPGADDGSSVAVDVADPEAESQGRIWNRASASRVF